MKNLPSDQPPPIVSSAHLASDEKGWELSELEYALTMSYNAFSRWMTHCMRASGQPDLNPLDILVLHNVNHRDKEKRLGDVAFMLNVEDSHTVNYSLKKLVKLELLDSRKVGKEIFYSTTDSGASLCEAYRDIRRACLLQSLEMTGTDYAEIRRIARILRTLSGVYDQASRSAASI